MRPIGPDKELINALARLLEAAKGTAAEYGVAAFVEQMTKPQRRVDEDIAKKFREVAG